MHDHCSTCESFLAAVISGVLCLQVAAEALVATEADLRAKLASADGEFAEKRQLLAELKRRYDAVAAELAGAEANLTSASGILTSAKAHLALKESLLFEKETLIAALRKQMQSESTKSNAQPKFWRSLARFRRDSGGQSDQKSANAAS